MSNIETALHSIELRRNRWTILEALYSRRMAAPVTSGMAAGALDEGILANLIGESERETRAILGYLQKRKLVDISEYSGRWAAKLKRTGIDLVEGTIACEPGIDRPAETEGDVQRRARIARARWYILYAINARDPYSVVESTIGIAVKDPKDGLEDSELRPEIYYLHARGLVDIEERYGAWFLSLTREGKDIVDYTIDCWAGIDRPPLG